MQRIMKIYCGLIFVMGTFAGIHTRSACLSDPCLNSGRCKASKTAYVCECKVDFTGINCEIPLAPGYQEAKGAFDMEPTAPELATMAAAAATEAERIVASEYFIPKGLEHQAVAAPGLETVFANAFLDQATVTVIKKAKKGVTVRVTIETTYLGCYSDRAYALVVGFGQLLAHGAMTIEMCVAFCRFQKLTYAGLKAGGDCRCRNFIAEMDILPDRNCHVLCTGNRTQICGGLTSVGVYTSCPMGFYGYMCQHRCRCAVYQCNIDDGLCPSNGCKYGWSGISCEDYSPEAVSLQQTAWYILAGTTILGAVVFAAGIFFAVVYKMGKVAWEEGIYKQPKDETDR